MELSESSDRAGRRSPLSVLAASVALALVAAACSSGSGDTASEATVRSEASSPADSDGTPPRFGRFGGGSPRL